MRYFLIVFAFICSLLFIDSSIERRPASYSSSDQIGVLGDLEGNLTRFNDFVESSGNFYRDEDGVIQLKEGHRFVFLGDATDRGLGSIRILKELISLKERYPDRVTLIMGNRDINKMRVHSLMKANENGPIPEIVVKWYKEILEIEHDVTFDEKVSLDDFRKIAEKYDSPTMRLKAFLRGMNAPKAFNYRRLELEELWGREVTDDEVYKSFVRDFEYGGLHEKYLKYGELAKIIDGNIFVHGAINNTNIGYVPGRRKKISDVHQWVDTLNQWANKEVHDWSSNPLAGQKLIKYHAPKKGSIKNEASVVYSRFSNKSGNAMAPDRLAMKILKRNGINRIIVGHTPTGDFPFIVRKKDFEVLLADSSFSSIQTSSNIQIIGKLLSISSKDQEGNIVSVRSSTEDIRNPIGMRTYSGFRVVGYSKEKDEFMLMKVQGSGRKFETIYETINQRDLKLDDIIEYQNYKDNCFTRLSEYVNYMSTGPLKSLKMN